MLEPFFIGLHQTVWQASNLPTADCQIHISKSSEGTERKSVLLYRRRQKEEVSGKECNWCDAVPVVMDSGLKIVHSVLLTELQELSHHLYIYL